MPDHIVKRANYISKYDKAEAAEPVKGAAEDPVALAKEHIAALGDPVKLAAISARYEAYMSGASEADKLSFDSAYNGAFVANGANTTEGKEKLQAILKGRTAIQALTAGVGLSQIIGANRKMKDQIAPKAPLRLEKNADLATQLNSAKSRQANGDVDLKRLFEGRLAESDLLANDRAKTTGQSGRFAANAQANSIRKNKTLQEFAAKESERRSGRRLETNQLIGRSINEDLSLKGLEHRQFASDQRDHQSNLNSLNQQRTSGIQNLFGALNRSADTAPLLDFRRKNGDPISQGELFSEKVRNEVPGLNDALISIARENYGETGELNNATIAQMLRQQINPSRNFAPERFIEY